MTSSASGPARLEAKGTLKERLTQVPGVMVGVTAAALDGRLTGWLGRSLCDRDMPKPIEGVIFSHPWRAWPVKLDILCIVAGCTPHDWQEGDGGGRGGVVRVWWW